MNKDAPVCAAATAANATIERKNAAMQRFIVLSIAFKR